MLTNCSVNSVYPNATCYRLLCFTSHLSYVSEQLIIYPMQALIPYTAANGCTLYVCFWLGRTKHSTSAIYYIKFRQKLIKFIYYAESNTFYRMCGGSFSLFICRTHICIHALFLLPLFFSTVSKVIFLWVWNCIVKNIACMSQAQIENNFL